ncbi:hypothetical protein [Chroococcidiopsis sp.]|uniref:hypothetical protein n=1 Tax=Chroococcidiopsis sp. TaxID=3088168 RepID=UPI003F34F04B
MTLVSNLGRNPTGLRIDNGVLTLESSLNDYPRATIVEYSVETTTRRIGSTITVGGLLYLLESISVNSAPDIGADLLKVITYQYVHISKKAYEFPIGLRDFLDKYKKDAVQTKKDKYVFPISALARYAMEKAGGGIVNPPNFKVEVPKTAGVEDTITLKQFCDAKALILEKVYAFSGSTLSFTSLSQGTIAPKIVSNYTIGYNSPPIYKDTILNWSKKQDYDPLQVQRFVQLKDTEYCIYEGDHQPHLPPPETRSGTFPRDLSIMADNSGVTKQFKITKYKWGQPAAELSGVFGYAHAALELVGDPNRPNQYSDTVLNLVSDKAVLAENAYQEMFDALKSKKFGFPDDAAFNKPMVWRLISLKETRYNYETFTPNIYPQIKKADGTIQTAYIPPEYQRYLRSNLKVLVSEETNGWELKRFAQEDAQSWTQGSIQAWSNLEGTIALKDKIDFKTKREKQRYFWALYQSKVNLEQYLYRKIPIYERVDYAIQPYSLYYRDFDEVEWTVQYIAKSKLFPDIKGDEGEEEIPVLFPDPNWVPQLMISAQSRYKTSVGISGNPGYNPDARNYFGSNPMTVLTGSDEYEFTKYGILPSRNTKNTITEMYAGYTPIEDVLGAVKQDQPTPGTYYTPHRYMTIGDYGIKGIPIPIVDPSVVAAKFPGRIEDKEVDQYTTQTTLRVAQDHSYKSHLTTSNFSLAQGRPPSASLIKPQYTEDKNDKDNPLQDSITYLNSGLGAREGEPVPSVMIDSADNIEEAIKGAKFKLTLDTVQSGTSASAQLRFTETTGYSIVNRKLLLDNQEWVVKRSTQSIQFSDGIGFTQQVEIECGVYAQPQVNHKTVKIDREDGEEKDSVKVLIGSEGLPSRFGVAIDEVPVGFSRWLDTNS